jgi:hypothetical protein
VASFGQTALNALRQAAKSAIACDGKTIFVAMHEGME